MSRRRIIKLRKAARRALLLGLLTLYIALNLAAAEPGLRFNRITTENGLSQNAANCILQDEVGFIWIGTQDGLNRYDGYDFKIFKNNPQKPASISNSYILSLLEDRSGAIWVGTYDGGLNKFDRKKETFTHYRHDPANPDTIASNHAAVLFQSPADPGVLWIGTDGGLSKFDLEREQFTNYRHDPQRADSLSSNIVHALFASPAAPDVLWIGTNGGLNRLDMKEARFTHFRHDPNNRSSLSHDFVRSIYEDRSGNLWIGSNGGLDLFERKAGRFIHFRHDPRNANSLSHNHVRVIYEIPAEPGVLWIGTFGGGLNRFNLEKQEFSHWRQEPGNPQSLNNDSVLSICQDRSGVVWIGCEGGVNLFDLKRKPFFHYQHIPNNANSLSHNDVRAICEDRTGTLWIGTYGGGLNRFDRDRDRFIHYRHDPRKTNSLSSDSVRVIHEDRDGTLWIGTYDGGLNRFEPGQDKFVHYKHDADDPTSLGDNYIRAILADRSGVLWVGCYGGGLNRFDEVGERFIRYTHDPDKPGSLSHNRVFALLEDKSGVLWVGTAGGLNRFDREEGKFTRYQNRSDDPYSLSNNMVMCIYEDRSGTLWVGTYGGGINRLDRKSGRFTRFTEDDGLCNDVVYGILEDGKGNLWLSTNKGLSRLNLRTWVFKNYETGDGLQHNEFNSGAYYKSGSGEMFFGGINGFNAFYPGKIEENSYLPPIVITNFQLFNKPVLIGDGSEGRSILTQSISETRLIELSHTDNVLAFEYAALHYVFPQRNQYAYMMQDLETDWNYVGNRRFASYAGLPPGEYIFRVKGTNNDGTWNEKGTSIRIKVIPPFWQTRLFYVLSTLFVLFVAVTLYWLRVRKLKRDQEELERLVDHRTEQLKSANKELEKLSIVAEKTDNAVIIMDARGNFEWMNEGFSRMYEYTLEQVIGEKGINILETSVNPNIKEAIETCIRERKTVSYETLNETRSGKKFWTQTTLTPIPGQDGELARLVAIESDITMIKESEEQIKKQNREILKQAEELKRAYEIANKEREAADAANRSKSMFLARMSHEIRTPLNGVIGFSDLLLETDLGEDQAEYAMTITRSGEALLALIDDILDVSRIEAGRLTLEDTDFDLEVMAFDVCNMVLPRLEGKNVEVLCRIGDNVPAYVKSDPGRIRQVLVNLMSNAAKFTDEGEIEISIDVEEENEEQLKLHACVRDTGPGIPEEQHEAIFELFKQVDGSSRHSTGGTGLGLSISRQIARMMGGDVWVEGAQNEGSTFHFTAWMDKSKKRPGRKRPAKFLANKRVLIIDDNVNNLVILSQILKRAGMIPIELMKSKEVLPTIQKSLARDEPIDLCILDIHMPAMSGFEVAARIRSHPDPRISRIPLLAFTSSVAKHTRRYRESGFDGFLPKPIQRHKLLAMLERLLGLNDKEKSKRPKKKRALITQHSLAEEAKHSIRILLAEDNLVNQRLVAHMLTNGGYQLDMVENGKKAVEKITRNPGRYDLVLMDINMPEMDGKEAARQLRERGFTNLPIIAMTAYAMKEDQEEFLKAGMDDYIAKPIKRELVYQMVNKWVLRSPGIPKSKEN